MTPTSSIVQQVARDFARRIADRPEAIALHISLEEEDAIVLWLETAPITVADEVALHELVSQTNEKYPDEYVLLRILNPRDYHQFDPRRSRPQRAEEVPIHEVVADINGAEDTRPS